VNNALSYDYGSILKGYWRWHLVVLKLASAWLSGGADDMPLRKNGNSLEEQMIRRGEVS